MLSYQHLYHAGNLADFHKHAALAAMLDYLTRKDKPLSYIETHAGRGLYDLSAPEARKTGEAAQGITRALREGWLPQTHPLAGVLTRLRADHGAAAYAGSPLIAAGLLRPEDRMILAELHPRENAALRAALPRWRADIRQEDGLKLALAVTPPTPRRGLMLIDPSYEVKSDYDALPGLMGKLARKWNVGVLVLWYPILSSGAEAPMTRALRAALPEVMLHEVRFPPARPGHGMIGSGLAIVNAPYGFADEAARLSALFAR